jgi:hypothetical protein
MTTCHSAGAGRRTPRRIPDEPCPGPAGTGRDPSPSPDLQTKDHTLTETPQATDIDRRELTSAIARIVASTDPAAFTIEPIFPGAAITARTPTPGAALAAALAVWQAAGREMRTQIRRSREAGQSWAELAVPLRPVLDLPEDAPPYEAGTAAFDWAAGPPRRTVDDRYVIWRCPSCGRLVSDYGPGAGTPEDSETGHSSTCARLGAAIEARRRDLDTWDSDAWDGEA